MEKVQVLLSTYNGVEFVSQQIESILTQTYSNITLFIRDDGSTDNTIAILEEIASNNPTKIRFVKGTNIGVIPSFLYLLENADENADYFCFCDQDDIWFPSKVERAVFRLRNNSIFLPGMVFTSTQMTNSMLEPIKIWPNRLARDPSFNNALVQNIAVGATVTFNKAARELLCNKKVRPDHILMHDWWAYLCISAFGKAYFDSEPSILYRQHSNNVVGGNLYFWDTVRKKLRSFQKHRGNRLLHKQALEFHRIYAEKLDVEKRDQLNLFLDERKNILQRFYYLRSCKLFRQSFIEQILFKFLILIGYI